MLTLGQAAKAAKVSKTTIHRAIRSGRLPASHNANGSYDIDPGALAQTFQGDRAAADDLLIVGAERDRFRELAEERLDALRDLRARLDASEDERRRVQEQFTAVLSTSLKNEARRSWWRGKRA